MSHNSTNNSNKVEATQLIVLLLGRSIPEAGTRPGNIMLWSALPCAWRLTTLICYAEFHINVVQERCFSLSLSLWYIHEVNREGLPMVCKYGSSRSWMVANWSFSHQYNYLLFGKWTPDWSLPAIWRHKDAHVAHPGSECHCGASSHGGNNRARGEQLADAPTDRPTNRRLPQPVGAAAVSSTETRPLVAWGISSISFPVNWLS